MQLLQVGYWLGQAHQGQGLVSRAVAALERVAAGLGITQLQILAVPGNSQSIRVAERAGYAMHGMRHQMFELRGVMLDELVYQKQLSL